MARLRPRNWSEFQHYKDRSPPWIKLHKGLLDDFEFNSLPLEARALAPMLWLLASEHRDGAFDADAQKLAFRLRTSTEQVAGALLALCDRGLFEAVQDACPETESERETEVESEAESDIEFENFWKAFDPPKNARKPDARRAWAATAHLRPSQKDLLAAVAGYRAWVAEQSRKQKRDYPMQHPATWLRGEVWNGFLQTGAADTSGLDGAWDGLAAPLVAEIGAGQFAAWFVGSKLETGPPARLTVAGEFRRKWIVEHFGAALRRCFGDVVVEAA